MKKITWALTSLLFISCFVSMYAQNDSKAIDQHFQQVLENNELLPTDVRWKITSSNRSRLSGVEHVYFRQIIEGLEVYGTESGVHSLSDGTLLSADNRFIKNAIGKTISGATASLSAAQAVVSAASKLGYSITEDLNILATESARNRVTLSGGGMSQNDIVAQLMYAANSEGALVLAWNFSIDAINDTHWWSLRVDANSGEIVSKNDLISSCGLDHDHSNDVSELDYNANLYDIPNYKTTVRETTLGCNECYEVIALPFESPYYAARSIENQPANTTASPFGWHDIDGVDGAEFTVTRGNNANAYEDGDNVGFQPDGGANLEFTGYPFDLIYSNTNQYESAAITNLFYWNNVIHDVMYQYGFDEESGNFQENNYGNGGAGSDSVNAEAQDGSGTCNANFGTPSDGQNPRMQMYVCGNKDGDFDNLVIAHEYGHGISNRFTGGPGASGCLQNQEQMGEGWSDFIGLILTMEPGDVGTDVRGIGTYLTNEGADGEGFRSFPYSTDMSVNPQTYDYVKTEVAPHGVGSVWSSMLWEMTWELIGEYGYSEDMYTVTGDVNQDAGNVIALALVMEGMRLQPCSPGFVDGRNAILAADQAIYNGANECFIWDAFARRGLGVSADQGSSGSKQDGTEAFDTPSQLASITAPDDICATSGELTNIGGGSPAGGVYSGPGVTDNGNGITYSFDPAEAGVGVHTITYAVPAGACSVASSASDTIEVLFVPEGPETTGVSDVCGGEPVTVTATLNDPANVIRWFDAASGGNFLFEGTEYTFSPSDDIDLYAQETPPGILSQLVISEITLETPDRIEIQNVGVATDYTGYTIAASEEPYDNINTINSSMPDIGMMGENSVIAYNDDGGSGYWGSNLWWDNEGSGWVIIIDPNGNVVDSLFWNYTAAEIATLNVQINGFTITGADLDWTGDGAQLLAECSGSFRRVGESDSAADWSGTCDDSDFGVPNSDIGVGFQGCLAERTLTQVLTENELPTVTCPEDMTEVINEGDAFTIPDYTALSTTTDNCAVAPTLSQVPSIGDEVAGGVYEVIITSTDASGNEETCTFMLTVDEILGVADIELSTTIRLYPNPTNGDITLSNKGSQVLVDATIFDVNGRLIKSLDLSNAGVETNVSISDLASGMYFMKITSEEGNIVKRIIKQ
ncbi:M36 family metallopeptidase [Cochleicola gelatinilyticus]|uniref:HYR domain-containing protein n=1 Tax=Cochleicola gelatinilyticus TaxID=1763537 RepID=A0A167HR59_9FLAO|nr:M36 family metallopeptidase [Cochleicola gelatinilyticus]OAB78878.1 hypothetical protein ULVI_09870 [Cochleicola gelatinilyticus]